MSLDQEKAHRFVPQDDTVHVLDGARNAYRTDSGQLNGFFRPTPLGKSRPRALFEPDKIGEGVLIAVRVSTLRNSGVLPEFHEPAPPGASRLWRGQNICLIFVESSRSGI